MLKRRTRAIVFGVPTSGDAHVDRWIGWNFRAKERWLRRWETVGETSPSNSTFGGLIKQWRNHLVIEGQGKVACVQCGRHATKDKNSLGVHRAVWLHQPCLGCKNLHRKRILLVQAGVFDGCLKGKDHVFRAAAEVFLQAENLVVEW